MMLLAIRTYFARAWCWSVGHTRGRRVSQEKVACRRCGAEWARPERKKAA